MIKKNLKIGDKVKLFSKDNLIWFEHGGGRSAFREECAGKIFKVKDIGIDPRVTILDLSKSNYAPSAGGRVPSYLIEKIISRDVLKISDKYYEM